MTVIAMEQVDVEPGNSANNSAQIVARTRAAFESGANIVVFPELANSGYVVSADLVSATAQALDGPYVGELTALTVQSGGLVATGFCERADDNYFNSVVVVGPDGPMLHYRKIHLFDQEKDVFTPGHTLPIIETEFGVLGVCVCYDLRFVEILRTLSLRGADIVLAPAAWVAGFDANVPTEGLTKQAEAAIVQANLDQVAVVAVSQVSAVPHNGLRTLGGSVAVDAFGDVICGPLSRTEPESALVTVDLDAGRAARVRTKRIRPRMDRRTDVYGLQYGDEIL